MGTYDRKRNSIATSASALGRTGAAVLTTGPPASAQPKSNTSRRARQQQGPVPVEATVHWWRVDEIRSTHAKNRFGLMPTTPVRFRCIGTLSAKYPKRYRVDLAQGLDWLPDLTPLELKELVASLAVAVRHNLGVDVAPIAADVIDLHSNGEYS